MYFHLTHVSLENSAALEVGDEEGEGEASQVVGLGADLTLGVQQGIDGAVVSEQRRPLEPLGLAQLGGDGVSAQHLALTTLRPTERALDLGHWTEHTLLDLL